MENKTFSSADVPLNFTINKPIREAYYTLDNRGNVTVSGNTTLTGLSNGWHNVTIYSIGENGIDSLPKTVYFNVDAPSPFLTVMATNLFLIIPAAVVFYFLGEPAEIGRMLISC